MLLDYQNNKTMVSPKIFINSIGQAYKVAPFGRRVWAFLIDFICISLIGLLILDVMHYKLYFYSLNCKK